MEKYLIRTNDTFAILEDAPLPVKEDSIFGVVGSSSSKYWTRNIIIDTINRIISDQERIPDAMMIPADGTTSIFMQLWAERQKISCSVYEADWRRLGRKAMCLRDSRIIKESTYLLIFLGTRSDYYEKIAIRESKKGKIVYTIDAKTHELTKI